MPVRLFPLYYAITFGLLIGIMTAIGVVANVVVVWAILSDRKMRRSAMNMLLLNLAVADIIFLVAHSTFWLQRMIMRAAGWYLPLFLCPVTFYAMAASIMVSILTYLVISVERYIAIVHPMSSRSSSQKKGPLVMLAVWLVAAAFHAPNFIYTNTFPIERIGNESQWVLLGYSSR